MKAFDYLRTRRVLARLSVSVYDDSHTRSVDQDSRSFIADSCAYHLATGLNVLRTCRRQDTKGFDRAAEMAERWIRSGQGRSLSEWVYETSSKELDPYQYACTLSLLAHLATLVSIDSSHRSAIAADSANLEEKIEKLKIIANFISANRAVEFSDFECALVQDPSNTYQSMSQASKGVYRSAVQSIGRNTNTSPSTVAAAAVDLASEFSKAAHEDRRKAHVGYYLLGAGVSALHARLRRDSAPRPTRSRNRTVTWRIFAYVALLLVLSLLATLLSGAMVSGLIGSWTVVLLLLVAVDAASLTCEALIGARAGHRHSLTIDLSAGIPDGNKLAIAVPMLLVSEAQIEEALDAAHWNIVVANDSNVRVYFLVDFPDSSRSGESDDERLLLEMFRDACASYNIRLGDRYASPLHVVFRDRIFSPMQQVWMGWERKRGKLEQFNELIRHGSCSELVVDAATVASLGGTTHVLCVDEDTRLTLGAVHEMMGFSLHPLNKPLFVGKKIVDGHALVVPTCLTRTQSMANWGLPSFASGGARMREDEAPQERRSFTYDYFGLSHYAGKGIYDVAAYCLSCNGEFPPEMILSHDTIEGAHLRPGYSSRAVLVESFPSSLDRLYCRQHRWARGDLQNLAHAVSRRFSGSALPGITQFIIFNQNRIWITNALLPLVILALSFQLESWMVPVAILILCTLPSIQKAIVATLSRGFIARRLAKNVAIALAAGLRAQFVRLVLSPTTTLIYLDALLTTIWRLLRGRGLLDWRAASLDINHKGSGGRIASYMHLGPLFFSTLAAYAYMSSGHSVCALLSGAWMIGAIAFSPITKERVLPRLHGLLG